METQTTTTENFWLPSREKLKDSSAYIDEFKSYLEELMVDAWQSRTERRAFRLLLEQLGGSVRVDIRDNPIPRDCLHLGMNGLVAVNDSPEDWPNEPVPAKLLAQAPQLLQYLKIILDIVERGDKIDVEELRRVINDTEEDK